MTLLARKGLNVGKKEKTTLNSTDDWQHFFLPPQERVTTLSPTMMTQSNTESLSVSHPSFPKKKNAKLRLACQ